LKQVYFPFLESFSFNSDISNWNLSNLKDMSGMLASAKSFNQDISRWNVSSVTSMHAALGNMSSFNGDISNWNVEKVDIHTHFFLSLLSGLIHTHTITTGDKHVVLVLS